MSYHWYPLLVYFWWVESCIVALWYEICFAVSCFSGWFCHWGQVIHKVLYVSVSLDFTCLSRRMYVNKCLLHVLPGQPFLLITLSSVDPSSCLEHTWCLWLLNPLSPPCDKLVLLIVLFVVQLLKLVIYIFFVCLTLSSHFDNYVAHNIIFVQLLK